MADVSLVRNRLRKEIEQARRSEAERRDRAKQATTTFDIFLNDIAVPAFRHLANVLRAEGMLFDIQTPTDGVRLVADRNREDVIELGLDRDADPPRVILQSSRTRGGRTIRREQPVTERPGIDTITEDELLERLFDELRPWLA